MGRFKEIFIGDGERYNYSHMCIPNNPFSKNKARPLNFYTKGEPSVKFAGLFEIDSAEPWWLVWRRS